MGPSQPVEHGLRDGTVQLPVLRRLLGAQTDDLRDAPHAAGPFGPPDRTGRSWIIRMIRPLIRS